MAITNKIDTMDPAFISRMEGRLFIKLPGPNEKIQLLSNILEGRFHIEFIHLRLLGLELRKLFGISAHDAYSAYCKIALESIDFE